MRSGSSTCAYGLPSQVGYSFERRRSAMRQSTLARARAVPKRKLREDSDSEADSEKPQHQQQQQYTGHARVTVDEFGNHVVLDGMKRMRVSSPPLPHETRASAPTSDFGDVSMDDVEDPRAIVRVGPATTKTPTLVGPAISTRKYAGPTTGNEPAVYDPSCRMMVLFNPYQPLPVERSPRIQFVNDTDKSDDESSSEDEANFVRFEELPDDEDQGQANDEAEAMELD